MDDDTIPHMGYEPMVRAAVRELPSDWMVLYLGFTQRKDHPPVPVTPHLCHPMASVDGSFAVMVSSRAYDPLLELLQSELAPVDAGALRELDRRHPTRVFALRVPAVIADVSTSSIRGPRDMAEHAAKAGWDLGKYRHRVPMDTTTHLGSELSGSPMRVHRSLCHAVATRGPESAYDNSVAGRWWSDRDHARFALRWPHLG